MRVNFSFQADKWQRDEPTIATDFSGRFEVYKIVKEIGKGKVILDAGCGEGFFSRLISDISDRIIGVDRDEEMIRLAIERELINKKGIEYHEGDVRNMLFLKNPIIDLWVSNYVANYLKPNELPQFYKELARVTKDNGKFILSIPHPKLRLITDYGEAIKYKVGKYDYVRSRGKWYDGKIRTIDGDIWKVGMYHSTLDDHKSAIYKARLKVNKIIEPIFPKEIAEKYPVFRNMVDKIDSMVLVGEK